MAAEKIDALELDIKAEFTTENLDKLITALGKLSKALDKVNAKRVKTEVEQTGESAKTAAQHANAFTNSLAGMAVKITALIAAYKKLSGVISDGLSNSMTYIKTLNMFNVSLGEYAANATKYGETVRDAMGIDIAGWQSAQGIFETLIKGFGVGGDRAAYMSQQLTQLTYDIASFYNLTTEEAQNKVKAALSGRIEPIRKLGWDISQGKLVDIASNPANYGNTTYAIDKETGALVANTEAVDDNTEHKIVNFNQLTQAEKVQLRYIALMTQVTQVQGNMGKTLQDPANQMRIFKEQTTMTARALGNIFIPALNQVLPYLTAFARLLEDAFQEVAKFFGFEIPDMSDRIGVENEVEYYDDIVEATGKAAGNAKKLRDYTIGIDELNVLNPNTGGAGGSGSAGGEQSNLNGLVTPGYDFLSKAIENSVNTARENLDKLSEEFKKHPIKFTKEIFETGAGELGSDLLTLIFGKTPEQLANEANEHGRTIGQQFMVEVYRTAEKVAKLHGEFFSGIFELLLGKSPEQMGIEAERYGMTIGEAFFYTIGEATSKFGFGKATVDIMTFLFGKPEELGVRAAEAGRTVGEQFTLEFVKKVADIFNSNPILKELYKIATGRDVEADLKKINRLLSGTSNRTKSGSYAKGEYGISKGTDAANMARKNGETTVKAYAEGMEYAKREVTKAGEEVYGAAVKGISKNGYGTTEFRNTSANEARKYGEGLLSQISNVSNAGRELYNAGLNGATDNGSGVSKYSSEASKMVLSYVNTLVTKYAKDTAYNNAADMAASGVSGAGSKTSGFRTAGENAGAGYVAGVKSYADGASEAGAKLGYNTLSALQKALREHSPSKATEEMGMYLDKGLAKGIEKYTYTATDAMKNMSKLALKAAEADFTPGINAVIPKTNNAGYGIGAANGNAMATLASNIYQAIVSGMSVVNANGESRDVRVIIDGKEVFNVVQSESRKRGITISNGAFGTI